MNMKRTILIVAAVMSVMSIMNFTVTAEDKEGDLPPIRKLSRGIANVGLGALEIPITIIDVNDEEGGFAAVTYGLLKGVSYCIAREAVGIVEIVTFLIPLPGTTGDDRDDDRWGYGPIMEPEWIVDPEHDYYNFVYPDYPLE